MKDNTFALKMNKDGELLLENSDDAVKAKYKPDSLLLCAPVSYLLMLFCVVIDIAFFCSLFVRISYDSPIMIWGQVAGLAFAADVVAAFAGILAKKIRQGLSHDKFNLALLLAVPIFALIINGVLRFSTMSLSSADGTVDAATIALTSCTTRWQNSFAVRKLHLTSSKTGFDAWKQFRTNVTALTHHRSRTQTTSILSTPKRISSTIL